MIDFHIQKAAELFDVEPADVTPKQRGCAKFLNYIEGYGGWGTATHRDALKAGTRSSRPPAPDTSQPA